MKDYKGGAEKFYSCASELVDLKRKAFGGMELGVAVYENIADEYGGILKKYETHTVKDFRSDHTKALAESKHEKDKGFWKKAWCHMKWSAGYFCDFFGYLFAAALLVFLFFAIVFNVGFLS